MPAERPRKVINVLHIYRRFQPDYTGDGIYFTKLIAMLVARGIEGEILVLETTTRDGEPRKRVGDITIHYLANECGRSGVGAVVSWLRRNIWRFDIVHAHSHVDRWFVSYLFVRLCGRKVIFSSSLNDSPTDLIEGYRPRYRGIVRLLSRLINLFIVISPHLLRRSLESIRPQRLQFIPQGVSIRPTSELRDKQTARRLLGLAESDFVLLNVGSVLRRKNTLFLVQALAGVADRRVKLIVVGPILDARYHEEVLAVATAEGVRDQVLLPGYCNDPYVYYDACDAFVFASLIEGFPNVFLEAMASGRPIVSRFLPGLCDHVIDHARTGLLADTLDQFIDCLRTLISDPAACARMGQEARRFVEKYFDIRSIAMQYFEVYRWITAEEVGAVPIAATTPKFRVQFCDTVQGGPTSLGFRRIELPPELRPMLLVVIDTEAEFDWQKGTGADAGQVSAIADLPRGVEVFLRHGLKPALVVDWPVASQDSSARVIQSLYHDGCEVGVHMQPWSTPPAVEPREAWHSYGGNLGPLLESLKIRNLTNQVCAVFGQAPTLFKAGRYGISSNTLETIEELGFETDLSVCPHYDYSSDGGPDFRVFDSHPSWFGRSRQLLSLPTTAGRWGLLRGALAPLTNHLTSAPARQLGLERLAARLDLLHPRRLSPEGNTLAELLRLTRDLYHGGLRVFTLTLHSPSFRPGKTPYVSTAADLSRMIAVLDAYLSFFRNELDGEFTTPMAVHRRLAALCEARGELPTADLHESALNSTPGTHEASHETVVTGDSRLRVTGGHDRTMP